MSVWILFMPVLAKLLGLEHICWTSFVIHLFLDGSTWGDTIWLTTWMLRYVWRLWRWLLKPDVNDVQQMCWVVPVSMMKWTLWVKKDMILNVHSDPVEKRWKKDGHSILLRVFHLLDNLLLTSYFIGAGVDINCGAGGHPLLSTCSLMVPLEGTQIDWLLECCMSGSSGGGF